jgi:hypothetical protein
MAPSTVPSTYNDSEHITSPLICRLLLIVARSADVGDVVEVLEESTVVSSWLDPMVTDGGVDPSLEDSEGFPGWVCSLVMVNSRSQFAHGKVASRRHRNATSHTFSEATAFR